MKTDFDTYFDNLEQAGKVPTFYSVPFDACTVGRTVQAVAAAFLKAEYEKGICYYCDPYGEYYQCSVKDRSCRHQIAYQDIQASLFSYIFFPADRQLHLNFEKRPGRLLDVSGCADHVRRSRIIQLE